MTLLILIFVDAFITFARQGGSCEISFSEKVKQITYIFHFTNPFRTENT